MCDILEKQTGKIVRMRIDGWNPGYIWTERCVYCYKGFMNFEVPNKKAPPVNLRGENTVKGRQAKCNICKSTASVEWELFIGLNPVKLDRKGN